MDIGEIAVCLPTLSSINDQIKDTVTRQCKTHLKRILNDIAENWGISLEELETRYLADLDVTDTVIKTRKTIDTDARCCAKTSKGERCTRKRKNGMFCGSHEHTRPYGEILEQRETKTRPVIKDRGNLAVPPYPLPVTL